MLSSRLLSIVHLCQTSRIREHQIYNLLRYHSIITLSSRRINDRITFLINTKRNLSSCTINRIIRSIVVLIKVELESLSLYPVKLHREINVVYREFVLIARSSIITKRDFDILTFILIKSLNKSIRCRIGLTGSTISANHNLSIVRYYLHSVSISLSTRKIK